MVKFKIPKGIKANSSVILAIAGGIGVVATAITASKNATKAHELLKKAAEEKSEELSRKEKFKIAAPVYIPTVIVGLSTIACITGGMIFSKKQQASLASAYALADKSFQKYRKKLKDIYGEEADKEICKAIAEDVKESNPVLIQVPSVFGGKDDIYKAFEESCENGHDTITFYDEISKRYFNALPEQVLLAEYHLNRNMAVGYGVVPLNTFYEFLGLEPIEGGEEIRWGYMDGYTFVDFRHERIETDEGLVYYMIFCDTPFYDEEYGL